MKSGISRPLIAKLSEYVECDRLSGRGVLDEAAVGNDLDAIEEDFVNHAFKRRAFVRGPSAFVGDVFH